MIVGILSDTHIGTVDKAYYQAIGKAFGRCSAIIHAGDLTDRSILEVFKNKEVYAVYGNMCNSRTKDSLPEKLHISLAGYSIGICHGAGPRDNIEERLFMLFPEADCIVYGHTHNAVCHRFGPTLILNPGSFRATGRSGAGASYALLSLEPAGMSATIHTLPSQL